MKRAACVLAVAMAAAPSGVRAYDEVDTFGLTPSGGGGGGRHFTGSPVDSYTCSACHDGGKVPGIRVNGLPIAGYVPGGLYEITVDWSDSLEHFAAAVELTDMKGKRAGKLRLPGADEFQDPELCEATISLGSEVVRVPPEEMANEPDYCGRNQDALPVDCRQVIHARSCGAQRLRFLWNAPSVDFGPIYFAGAGVNADDDNSDRGDGVAEFAHVLASRNKDNEVDVANAGCSVASRPNAHGLAWLWFAAAIVLGSRRRLRKFWP